MSNKTLATELLKRLDPKEQERLYRVAYLRQLFLDSRKLKQKRKGT